MQVSQGQLNAQSSVRRLSLNPLRGPSPLSSLKFPRRHSMMKQSFETSQLSRTLDLNPLNNHQIYFNRTKKYNYMKSIIDKYFQEEKDNPQNYTNINTISYLSTNNTISYLSTNSSSNSQTNAHHHRTLVPRVDRSQEKHVDEKNNKTGQHLARRRLRQRQEEEPLTISRLLVEDKSQASQSVSLCQKSCGLPPIDELFQQKQDQQSRYDSISYLDESVTLDEKYHRTTIKVSQNEIYKIEIVMAEGRAIHKLKTYSQKGLPVLQRQRKAVAIGVQPYWVQYKYDPNTLMGPVGLCLRDLLFRARKIDAESKYFTLKPKKYYAKLMANSCEELKRVIVVLCKQLQQVEGRLTNNCINTGNLFMKKNEDLGLGEWGFSTFRETHFIQGIDFQNRLDPVLKSQNEWLIPPEYMAPEILRAVAMGEDTDLPSLGSSPDIWSLGVCVFEVVTLIPVWMEQKCVIYGKEGPPRRGELAVDRDLAKLLKREQKLPYLLSKILAEWEELPPSITSMICRCVDYSPQNRPNFQEIIEMLG